MIKNERQAAIVRSRLKRLEALEAELRQRLGDDAGRNPLGQLELDTVVGEASTMRTDLKAYEELRAGQRSVGPVSRLDELPRALIEGRIAAGLSQADLAGRLGLKEQQIQRYESTEYEGANLARLIEVADAVGLTVAPGVGTEPSAEELERRLDRAGLPKDLLRRRFRTVPEDRPVSAAVLAGRVAHVFGTPPDEVLEGRVDVDRDVVAAGRYKLPARASDTRTIALSGYARYLTRIVAYAVQRPISAFPASPLHLHRRILDATAEGRATYEGALRAAWSAGVPVVPLSEPGGFHAGFWVHGTRPVIVLNPTQRNDARWMFDLLHECGHLALDHATALTEDSPSEGAKAFDTDEVAANEFASQAVFGGRSEELWEIVWNKSGGKAASLQRTVRMVARQQSVDAGALALNVAFRLSAQGTSWWAAASKLQVSGTDPWVLTRDVLLEELNWGSIDRLDAQMLSAALAEVD